MQPFTSPIRSRSSHRSVPARRLACSVPPAWNHARCEPRITSLQSLYNGPLARLPNIDVPRSRHPPRRTSHSVDPILTRAASNAAIVAAADTGSSSSSDQHERPAGQPCTSEASTSEYSRSVGAQAAAEERIWCARAPSAAQTLQAIVKEVQDLGGPDLKQQMEGILTRDPTASVQSATLRASVAHLLSLREFKALSKPEASAGAPGYRPELQPWARESIEGALFDNEVRRVFNDLLKDKPTLQREEALRAAAVSSAETSAPQSHAAVIRSIPEMIRKSPILTWPIRVLDALYGMFVTPIFIGNPTLWRTRDLQHYADILRHDATLQALYLRRLNKSAPEAVIQRMQSKAFASNEACEVEFLKALVKTKTIEHFAGAGPPPPQIAHTNLPLLLSEMNKRLTSSSRPPAESTSSAMSSAVEGGFGSTQAMPLHIRLDSLPPSKVNPIGSVLKSTFSFFFTIVIIVSLWVLGAAAESKLSGGEGISNGLAAQSTSLGDKASSYAPKEYNKEVVPEASKKTFADVKGCDEAKEELQEVVEYLKNPGRFVKMGAKLPKGVLLAGPPGTGKTLLARAVAGEANVPFFYRAGSEFEEMFVGVGSRRVRALFQAAKKKAPCIIFIDEIDSIGSNRKQWDNHSRKTLNQMLTEMDGFEENTGVIIMAATNLPEVLDPALTRPGRFDRRVTVNIPDIKGREEILNYYLSSKPLSDDINVNQLARKTGGFSGAQLSNMVNEAALQAAKEGAEKLDLRLLDEARDKVMMGKERTLTRTENNIERTAYHEAGHALVALWTDGADPLHKATINPRGDALGLTWQLMPQDEYSRSRSQLKASIDVCMGGQVAETLVYGSDNVGSGATSDLQQATNLARHMVFHCGFSPEIGPMYIDDKSSPETRVAADKEVCSLLKTARTRVQGMLEERLTELHAVAKALMRDETLSAQEILDICEDARTSTPSAAPPTEEMPEVAVAPL